MELQQEVNYDDTRNGLKMLMTDLNSLLILGVSFFMSFRSKTIYVVTSSIWMEETFDLNASYVGWSTMSVIIGECLALGVMTTLSHKLQLWQCAGGALLHQLFVGALVFVLSAVYGNEYHLGMKNTIKMIDNMIKMHKSNNIHIDCIIDFDSIT